MTFAHGALKINGILGFPVIKEFQAFDETSDSLIIPAHSTIQEKVHHNLSSKTRFLLLISLFLKKNYPLSLIPTKDLAKERLMNREPVSCLHDTCRLEYVANTSLL